MSRYPIPKADARAELRVFNSRFVATADVASTVSDAQAVIRSVRSSMPAANHHVYAFRVGFGQSISEGMSDDGEPSGTAGPPVLAVVRGSGLGDLVIVVTRFFGGTKLGTGGLVSAYTKAAQAVLEKVDVEEKVIRVRLECAVPYRLHGPARRVLADHAGVLDTEEFEDQVRLGFRIDEDRMQPFLRDWRDATAGQYRPIRVKDP